MNHLVSKWWRAAILLIVFVFVSMLITFLLMFGLNACFGNQMDDWSAVAHVLLIVGVSIFVNLIAYLGMLIWLKGRPNIIKQEQKSAFYADVITFALDLALLSGVITIALKYGQIDVWSTDTGEYDWWNLGTIYGTTSIIFLKMLKDSL